MPVLDSPQFQKTLPTLKDFKPVYLFAGDEEALIADTLNAFKSAFSKRYGNLNPDFNLELLYGEKDPIERILDAANTLPFSAEKKLIILQRTEELPDDALDQMADYCRAPNPSSCLVLILNEKPNPAMLSKGIAQAAAETGAVVKHWKPFEDRRPEWIRAKAGESGKKISFDAADLLSREGGESLNELRTEIEKLLLFVGDRPEISLKDVQETMSFRRNRSVWKMMECLEKKEMKEAGKILENCLEQGEEPIMLLNLIARSVRSMPSKHEKTRARLFEELKRTDLMLKSGQGKESAAFERLMVLIGGS